MGVKRKQPCAHENHEQGIIVSSRLFMQRMRMMPVLLNRHCKLAFCRGGNGCGSHKQLLYDEA